MRSVVLVPMLLLAACSTSPVRAADDAPAAPPEPASVAGEPRPADFSLHTFDGFIDLRGEYENTRVRTSQPGRYFRPERDQRNRRLGFEESVGLRLGGWYLDPRTVAYDAELAVGLSQDRFHERIDSSSYTDEDDGGLLRYDARVTLFSDQKLSGSVYALRAEDRIARQFQPSLDRRRTGAGTSWVLSDERFPMELSYDFLDTDRDGNVDERDDEETRERTLRYRADANFSEDHRARLTLEHSDNRQDFQGTSDAYETRREFAEVDHELHFGPGKKHELRTLLQWQDEQGDFARDFLRAGPRLTLQHTDDFRTFYEYQFTTEDYDEFDIRSHRVDAGFVHQLYRNLTTTVDVFGLREDVEGDVDTRQQGGSVDWQYNRGNPWGRLYANLALGYDTEDTRGGGDRRVVFDEAVTIRDPLDGALRNRNVIEPTIVVTDTTNRRVFQPGVDYVIVNIENTTRISRVPTGRIADRETVFVDYQYRTPGDGELDTVRTDFSLEQRFDGGLTPYYRFSFRDQDEDDSTMLYRRADRTDHHRLGVSYDPGRFSLGAEYEIFDDSVEPFDGYHLTGRVDLLRDAAQTVAASSRFSRLWFEGGYDDRNVSLVDVELSWRRRFTRTVSASARLAYRWEDDSIDGITKGWDATAGMQCLWGDVTGELTLEYNRLDLPESLEDDYGAFVQVRRSFPNLPGGRGN